MNQIKNQLIFHLKVVLFLFVLFIISFVFLEFPKLSQDFNYHNFADQRTLFNTPNFFNVVSNAPLCLIGLVGLFWLILRKDPRPLTGEKSLSLLFMLGLILTGIGSAYYHLHPSHYTLVYDRVAIAFAFTTLFSFLITERLFPILGLILFPLFLAFGVFSAIYWYQTELIGQGDLRPYLLVQILPLISIPIFCLLFPKPHRYDRLLLYSFLLYLIAIIFEWSDSPLYLLSHNTLSGHTLKHLTAVVSSLLLVIYLIRKKTIPK